MLHHDPELKLACRNGSGRVGYHSSMEPGLEPSCRSAERQKCLDDELLTCLE
jgi:hypothetical protein